MTSFRRKLNQLWETTKHVQTKEILKDYSGKILTEATGAKTMANGFKEPKQNHLRKRTLKPLN